MLNPNQTVLYNNDLYTIYACGKSYAVVELKDRPFIKKQVRVKDLQKI